MIRFDEVPIGRRFKYYDARMDMSSNWIKIPESYPSYVTGSRNAMEYKKISQINTRFFSEDEMVELVDKCANCKHYDSNIIEKGNHPKYCHWILAYIGVEHEDINDDSVWNVDPETFKCSNWEEK